MYAHIRAMKVLDTLSRFWRKKKLRFKLAKDKQNGYKNLYNGSCVDDKNLKILQMEAWHFTNFLPKEIEILKLYKVMACFVTLSQIFTS